MPRRDPDDVELLDDLPPPRLVPIPRELPASSGSPQVHWATVVARLDLDTCSLFLTSTRVYNQGFEGFLGSAVEVSIPLEAVTSFSRQQVSHPCLLWLIPCTIPVCMFENGVIVFWLGAAVLLLAYFRTRGVEVVISSPTATLRGKAKSADETSKFMGAFNRAWEGARRR